MSEEPLPECASHRVSIADKVRVFPRLFVLKTIRNRRKIETMVALVSRISWKPQKDRGERSLLHLSGVPTMFPLIEQKLRELINPPIFPKTIFVMARIFDDSG